MIERLPSWIGRSVGTWDGPTPRPDGLSAASTTVAAPRVTINGRFRSRSHPTGVDRLAIEVADRMTAATVIEPSTSGVVATNLWEQLVAPLRARNDVLISLANSGPVFARRHVAAIHDTAHWDHPEWFSTAYRTKARALNRSWARTARVLVCPSRTVAANISRWLGRDLADISVVGNGHRWEHGAPERRATSDPFVLAVGTVSTRKNLGALIRAWPLVRRERPELGLRIVGSRGGHLYAGSTEQVEDPSIQFLGYVTDTALDELFTAASCLVAPSRYEGFDIPILDALTAGTPVVASDIDVHRELFDGACLFADPNDREPLAAAVLDASRSCVADAVRDELRSIHSWANVARRVEQAVERAWAHA